MRPQRLLAPFCGRTASGRWSFVFETIRRGRRQALILREMTHRIKDLFSIVQGLIGVSEKVARNARFCPMMEMRKRLP
jgi:two-component sensor histidine kinase